MTYSGINITAHAPRVDTLQSWNVAALLLLDKNPTDIAVVMPDGVHTYGDVQALSRRVAALLQQSGAKEHDRVLLAGDNSLFWVAAYLGTLLANCVVVPVPTDIPQQNLEHILCTTGARFAFAQQDFAEHYRSWFDSVSAFAPQDIDHPVGDFDASALCATSPDSLAALMFTSGSTGEPRGVMISHGNIVANTRSIVEYLGLAPNDRMMAVLPFHYCFGASLLHTHFWVGGSLVVEHRFMFPELFLRRLQETACTGFAGVSSHYQILLHRSGLRHMNFPRLRHVQQAGGHMPAAAVTELRNALPGVKVFVMYGQTEATARLSYLAPEFLDTKLGSIGRGIPGVRLTVVDEQGAPVQPNQVGEIIAEGANIGLGYWRDDEETEKYFRDGKLRTGDLATIDKDGFIYIVGRSKDFVKCGGTRISCRQIEDQLLTCSELLEAAVVGIPDATLGEAIKIFVVPREQHGGDVQHAVRSFCAQHFPCLLQPRQIVVLDALPKNSAGKVMKSRLKETV